MSENSSVTEYKQVAESDRQFGVNTDITAKDYEKIKLYKEEGLPDIAKIDDAMLLRIMSMYLEGKTYRQISHILYIKKVQICYLSDKFNWYAARQEYLAELDTYLRARIHESKMRSQDFMLHILQFYQKKIGSKIDKYLATDNEAYVKDLDPKDIDKYLKTVEILQKLSADPSKIKENPAIGLNLGDGVTIKRKGNNEVEITPKQKSIGEMLKQYADSRREEEVKDMKMIKNPKEDDNNP